MGAKRRIGLVLSGGGARGAYEVGVLAHVFERILPQLPPDTDFDVVSGTSVGAIHAAYTAATSQWEPAQRARRLTEIWRSMELARVVRIGVGDMIGVPLRALGLSLLRRRAGGRVRAPEVIGGLLDVSPLERIVADRIPWEDLRENLGGKRPRALCVLCTEVRTGRVAVFLDGALADAAPWASDPQSVVVPTEIGAVHVRASAAIPFLFPAVRIGDGYYVDGGLRMNTPLSPALRLGCDRLAGDRPEASARSRCGASRLRRGGDHAARLPDRQGAGRADPRSARGGAPPSRRRPTRWSPKGSASTATTSYRA